MRTVAVVPADEQGEFSTEPLAPYRHTNPPSAFVLQREVEPLDDRNASMLADCTVAWPDPTSPTPIPESLTEELASFVADEVAWGMACLANGSPEEGTHTVGTRLLLEDHHSLHASREVVDNDRHPPAEGPLLRKGEGKPESPEACSCRDGGEVYVPDMIRPLRLYEPIGNSDHRLLEGYAGLSRSILRTVLAPR